MLKHIDLPMNAPTMTGVLFRKGTIRLGCVGMGL
jgi:hypothetical protein